MVTNEATGFPADTYLSVKGWGKGLAFVNGFNLGALPATPPLCPLKLSHSPLSQKPLCLPNKMFHVSQCFISVNMDLHLEIRWSMGKGPPSTASLHGLLCIGNWAAMSNHHTTPHFIIVGGVTD